MPIPTFGITSDSIRAHHFPQLSPFSTASKPTAATVTEKIADAAADLAGKLAQEGISAETIDTGADTYPVAYQWCAKTVRLGAAIGTLQAGATADPEVAKAWREELARRFEALDDYGHLALGDAPEPATPSNGPLTHINVNSLEVSDSDDMSSAVPTFRKNDLL